MQDNSGQPYKQRRTLCDNVSVLLLVFVVGTVDICTVETDCWGPCAFQNRYVRYVMVATPAIHASAQNTAFLKSESSWLIMFWLMQTVPVSEDVLHSIVLGSGFQHRFPSLSHVKPAPQQLSAFMPGMGRTVLTGLLVVALVVMTRNRVSRSSDACREVLIVCSWTTAK